MCNRCGQENPEGFAFCGACGAPLAETAPARDVRKTVTVVFSDVTGSTGLGERLDPESLRRVMGRYFDEMKAVVERHEGTVEKFIGDAVMAVFGIPFVHEDDALRAVRAAAEMRERLEALNEELDRDWGVRIEVRTGVNTGEVVAGDASGGQRFATGDAVNVAKRFEEAAPPGEILLGETTHQLVRDAVQVEPLENLDLKGKAEAVTAYRLLSIELGAEGRARRLDSPMVGRERERTLLNQAHERAVGDGACHLFTVLGAAGVGKSRIVAEFLQGIGNSATVVQGRCLPYGEGITFRPVLEVVRMLGEDPASVGLAEGTSPSDETAWAVRKLLEAHAQERPLVVVFDDVQWGEPTFLDLVEHVADLSRDAPILIVCLARPELLDGRPGWSGGKFNATSVLLEPLGDDDSAELIGNLLERAELDPAVRARVVEAAEGNPLFVEEMLGMLIDDGLLERQNGNWVTRGDVTAIAVPPTIQALLSARLDRLDPPERAVVERASIEGKVFHRGAVSELAPSELRSDVGGLLQALVRKELLRPNRAEFVGEDAFRFRHLLIRDAAYDAMPKELRSELHERYAAWLERMAGERRTEYEEIIGFHLEQAYRYRIELAPLDDEAQSLGSRAGERLASAGARAFARTDAPAAINLLDRALEVLPRESPLRLNLQCDLGLALSDRGDFARAQDVLSAAITAAEAQNEPALAAVARMRSTWTRLLGGGAEQEQSSARAEIEESVQRLAEVGHETGLAEAYSLLGTLLMWSGRCADAMEFLESSAGYARQAGADRFASRSLSWLVVGCFWGPMTVSDGLLLCDRVLGESSDRYVEAFASLVKGALLMMAGDWEMGEALEDAGRKQLEELGQQVTAGSTRMASARVQLIAGRFDEAEEKLRLGYEMLEPIGEKGYLSTTAALLGVVLCAEGRHAEAEHYVQEARELGAEDDITTQVYWRCAQAEVHASRSEFTEAFGLLGEVQNRVDATDYSVERAAALMSRAVVEKAAGDRDLARATLERAIELLEQKGDVTGAAGTRERLAAL
jgi:class 3 adenylate cyclase/tetratricopeptide (TPR) repeat protein